MTGVPGSERSRPFISSILLVYLFAAPGKLGQVFPNQGWTKASESLSANIETLMLPAIVLALALRAPGLISPVVLFAALTAYSVMGFGARFANRDSDRAPRTTRTFFYFGVVLLTLSAVLFQTNVWRPGTRFDQRFQTQVDNAFILGSFLFLMPYFFCSSSL